MQIKKMTTEPARPVRDYEVVVGIVCDLCGREGKGDDWTAEARFKIDETEVSVTVRHKEGNSYPEGGNATEYSFDICPECFHGKLIPWLRSEGAEARIKKSDW